MHKKGTKYAWDMNVSVWVVCVVCVCVLSVLASLTSLSHKYHKGTSEIEGNSLSSFPRSIVSGKWDKRAIEAYPLSFQH